VWYNLLSELRPSGLRVPRFVDFLSKLGRQKRLLLPRHQDNLYSIPSAVPVSVVSVGGVPRVSLAYICVANTHNEPGYRLSVCG